MKISVRSLSVVAQGQWETEKDGTFKVKNQEDGRGHSKILEHFCHPTPTPVPQVPGALWGLLTLGTIVLCS